MPTQKSLAGSCSHTGDLEGRRRPGWSKMSLGFVTNLLNQFDCGYLDEWWLRRRTHRRLICSGLTLHESLVFEVGSTSHNRARDCGSYHANVKSLPTVVMFHSKRRDMHTNADKHGHAHELMCILTTIHQLLGDSPQDPLPNL